MLELCLLIQLYSEKEVIPVSGVHKLLTKIHDILDNAVYKGVGNMANILA